MPAVTTITDPSGFAWILDGTLGMWEGQGKKGFHAPTYIHYRDESPAIAGGFYRGTRAVPRELFLPVVIRDQNRDNVLARRRALIRAISPLKGECVITSAWPDGSSRSIRCRYLDGIDAGEQGAGEYGITVLRYGLRFIADDPYTFGDTVPSQWDFTASSRLEIPIPGADTFFEVVSSPLLASGAVINNTGDVDSYPSWTFIGPFTQVTLGNSTTGKSFTMLYTAASSANKLFVITEPGGTSIVDETGVNRWNTLTAGYSLWPLVVGSNTINVALVGASAGTSALMSYRPRFEGD
jgi:hypothetical protein